MQGLDGLGCCLMQWGRGRDDKGQLRGHRGHREKQAPHHRRTNDPVPARKWKSLNRPMMHVILIYGINE